MEGECLVIWENKWPGDFRDIYAQRVQENGELKSLFTVVASAYEEMNRTYLRVISMPLVSVTHLA